MFPTKIYTLKVKNSNLGFNFNDKSYIVGFNNKPLAIRCNHLINPLPKIDINIKRTFSNNSDIVDMKIETRPFSKIFEHDIEEISIAKFLTYPITNNIGILIGLEVVLENESDITIESMLIESFNNPRFFSPE